MLQIFSVMSSLQEARNFPCGSHLMAFTSLVWPWGSKVRQTYVQIMQLGRYLEGFDWPVLTELADMDLLVCGA